MFSLFRTLLVTAAVQQGAADAKRRLRRALLQLAVCAAGGLLILGGLIFFLAALHDALAVRYDPLSAKLICGGALLLLGAVAMVVARQPSARRRVYPERPAAASADIAASLGQDVETLLSRNAGLFTIGAFVAGLLIAAKRR